MTLEAGLRDCAMYDTGREAGFLAAAMDLSEME
jgi:hypothetical protein